MAATVQSTPAVLRLPDEILLRIVSCLDGRDRNRDLINLGLAHRHFRDVVHETLVRHGVVPARSIPRFLELLYEQPVWVATYAKLELGNPVAPDSDFILELTASHRLAIREAFQGEIAQEMEQQLEQQLPRDGIAEQKHDFLCFQLLLILLPAVHNLHIKLPRDNSCAFYDFLNKSDWRSDITDGDLLHCFYVDALEKRITTLTIEDRSLHGTNPKYPLQLWHMQNLKVLSVPGQVLQGFDHPSRRYSHRYSYLSESTEVLRIFCNEITCPWLYLYYYLFCGHHEGLNRRLRSVELYFSISFEALDFWIPHCFRNATWRAPRLMEARFLEHPPDSWTVKAFFPTISTSANGQECKIYEQRDLVSVFRDRLNPIQEDIRGWGFKYYLRS